MDFCDAALLDIVLGLLAWRTGLAELWVPARLQHWLEAGVEDL